MAMSDILRYLNEKQDYSYQHMARIFNVSASTLNKIVNGSQTKIPPMLEDKVFIFLNLDEKEIFLYDKLFQLYGASKAIGIVNEAKTDAQTAQIIRMFLFHNSDLLLEVNNTIYEELLSPDDPQQLFEPTLDALMMYKEEKQRKINEQQVITQQCKNIESEVKDYFYRKKFKRFDEYDSYTSKFSYRTFKDFVYIKDNKDFYVSLAPLEKDCDYEKIISSSWIALWLSGLYLVMTQSEFSQNKEKFVIRNNEDFPIIILIFDIASQKIVDELKMPDYKTLLQIP